MPIQISLSDVQNPEQFVCKNPNCKCTHEIVVNRYWQQFCCKTCRDVYWQNIYRQARKLVVEQTEKELRRTNG